MKAAIRKNHNHWMLWIAVIGWTMIGSSLSHAFSVHDYHSRTRIIHTNTPSSLISPSILPQYVGSITNTNYNSITKSAVVPNARNRGSSLANKNGMRLYATSTEEKNGIVDPIIVQKIFHNNNDNEQEDGKGEDTTIIMEQQQQQTKKRNDHHHGVHPIILKWWRNFRTNLYSSTNPNQTTQQTQTQTRAQPKNHLRRKTMTLLASAVVMFAVLFAPLQDAFAAPSGGRMGGSFGGSSRSSRSSSSYSRPSSSGSYSRGFSQGYGAGYYSRPSVTIAPTIGGYGYYGTPIVRPSGVAVVRTGPSIIDMFLWVVFMGVAVSAFRSTLDYDDNNVLESALGKGMTVAEITIALNVPRRDDPNSILSFLNRLSRTASTDSRVGVSNLVSQVSLELMRQKAYIFAADAEYKHYSDDEKAKRNFNQKALEERSKFEKETTNRYGGVDYGSGRSSFEDKATGQATSAVVTILIAIEGDKTKFPTINNISDLQKALTTMATDVKVDDCLRSAEVLWTPDDNVDVLTERDVIVDYPKLRSV